MYAYSTASRLFGRDSRSSAGASTTGSSTNPRCRSSSRNREHIFAGSGQPDSNLILRLWDAGLGGARQLITTGYLKASRREIDARTTDGNPHRPHTRAIPVGPGAIEGYAIRLYPFAASFRPGHRLVVELSNDEPLVDEHNALLPPDAFHLPVGRPVTHKICRHAAHPSRLLLPFTEA